jgi:hypothetical protein
MNAEVVSFLDEIRSAPKFVAAVAADPNWDFPSAPDFPPTPTHTPLIGRPRQVLRPWLTFHASVSSLSS